MITRSFILKFCMPLVVALVGLDWFLKSYMMMMLRSIPEKTIPITSFFSMTEVWNYGVSFGMFSANTMAGVFMLMAVALFILIFLGYLLIKSENYLEAISFSLIIGGALGNLYDRVVYNAVYDFLDFHYQQIHFWTFNPADVFISLGAIILVLGQVLDWFKKRKIKKMSASYKK